MVHKLSSDYDLVLPENWRRKAVVIYDAEFVKTKIIVPSLIEALGSDYVPLSVWLTSLGKQTVMNEHFQNPWGGELKLINETSEATLELVAVMLAYTTLIHRFPKASPTERRQYLRDCLFV